MAEIKYIVVLFVIGLIFGVIMIIIDDKRGDKKLAKSIEEMYVPKSGDYAICRIVTEQETNRDFHTGEYKVPSNFTPIKGEIEDAHKDAYKIGGEWYMLYFFNQSVGSIIVDKIIKK